MISCFFFGDTDFFRIKSIQECPDFHILCNLSYLTNQLGRWGHIPSSFISRTQRLCQCQPVPSRVNGHVNIERLRFMALIIVVFPTNETKASWKTTSTITTTATTWTTLASSSLPSTSATARSQVLSSQNNQKKNLFGSCRSSQQVIFFLPNLGNVF